MVKTIVKAIVCNCVYLHLIKNEISKTTIWINKKTQLTMPHYFQKKLKLLVVLNMNELVSFKHLCFQCLNVLVIYSELAIFGLKFFKLRVAVII